MKKFLVCFAVMTVMVFIVGCGGSDNNSSGGSSGSYVCSYGNYECHGDDSYFCGYPDSGNDLMWLHYESCNYGCNYSTGKCYMEWESDGNNGDNNSGDNGNNNDNSSECTSGKFKCVGNESHYCNSNGSWVYDSRCEYGCDYSTGKCNESDFEGCPYGEYGCSGNTSMYCNQDRNWVENESCDYECDPSTGKCKSEECTTGKYKCSGDNSMYCNNGFWKVNESCEYGCDSSTGKCSTNSEGCTSGKYKCYGENSMICKDGFWENNEYCNYGCDYSTGKCKTAECSAGEEKCSGSIYYCKNGKWQVKESCDYGCDTSTLTCKPNPNCYKIDGKIWSNYASNKNYKEAKTYCENLNDCGYTDWRLPTIDEPRTIIQNCPNIESNGTCKVSEKKNCLSYNVELDDNYNQHYVNSCYDEACHGCSSENSTVQYSKFGDSGLGKFWSSSKVIYTNPLFDGYDDTWTVIFSSTQVFLYNGSSGQDAATFKVRCVRSE